MLAFPEYGDLEMACPMIGTLEAMLLWWIQSVWIPIACETFNQGDSHAHW